MKKSNFFNLFFFTILISLHSGILFGQVSFFQNINNTESGSFPRCITKFNDKIVFVGLENHQYYLYLYDFQNNKLNKLDSARLVFNQFSSGAVNPFLIKDSLIYYNVYSDSINENTLKVSNGIWTKIIKSKTRSTDYFCKEDIALTIDQNKVKKLKDDTEEEILTFNFANYSSFYYPPAYINDTGYFFGNQFTNLNTTTLKIYQTDFNSVNLLNEIQNVKFFNNSINFKHVNVLTKDTIIFLPIIKHNFGNKDTLTLYKVENNQVSLVYSLLLNQTNSHFNPILHLTSYKDKILFYLDVEPKGIYISDGTSENTYRLLECEVQKTEFHNFWLKTDENIGFFVKIDGIRHWVTYNSSSDILESTPILDDFLASIVSIEELNDEILVLNNEKEIWRLNKQSISFSKVLDLPKNHPIDINFISTNYLRIENEMYFSFSNFTDDYEFWRLNLLGNASPTLIKNINLSDQSGIIGDQKIKLNNFWFFPVKVGENIHIFKTDGVSSFIMDTLSKNNEFFFVNNIGFSQDAIAMIYRSKEFGKVNEIKILLYNTLTGEKVYHFIPSLLNINTKIKILAFGDKFIISDNYRVYSVDELGIYFIQRANIDRNQNFKNIIVKQDKIYLLSNNYLTVSENGEEFALVNKQLNPFAPTTFLRMDYVNDGIYCVGFDYELLNGSIHSKFNLYKVNENLNSYFLAFTLEELPNFSSINFDNYLIYKDENSIVYALNPQSGILNRKISVFSINFKTNNYHKSEIYFNGIIYEPQSYDLDGFLDGNRKLILSKFNLGINSQLQIHEINETSTEKINNFMQGYVYILDIANFKNKLYFSISFDFNRKSEIHTFKNNKFYSVESDNENKLNYKSNKIMSCADKLLFTSFSEFLGLELYQYSPFPCEGSLNYTINSGNWHQPEVWSCGHTPRLSENVLIKKGHKISHDLNENSKITNIETEYGAVLDIKTGSVFSVN